MVVIVDTISTGACKLAAMPSLTEYRAPELRKKLESARKAMRRIREKGEQIGMNIGTFALGASTAYGTGYAHGWAERTGKSLDLPGTEVSGTLVAGLIFGALGASDMLGRASPWMMALGAGATDANLGLTGYKHGIAPPNA